MPALADLAHEAFSAGWALSGGPMPVRFADERAAAVAAACERPDDPRILEATLNLGSLTGMWATVYARRAALERKHLARVMAAWNAIVSDLDARELASQFRAHAYLPAESAGPQVKFWRDTGTAAALAWLRKVYDSDGYGALLDAISDAIRSGMAEGEAGALALAASKQGKTGFGIAKAFKAAYTRLAGDSTIAATAAAALTRIIDGAGADLGRRLASVAGDDGSEDDMTGAVDDMAAGDDVSSVTTWTDWALWAAFGAGALALYGNAGGGTVSILWVTAADGKVCAACQDNEDNSPFTLDSVPAYPQHPRCRCYLDSADAAMSAQLMAYYFG